MTEYRGVCIGGPKDGQEISTSFYNFECVSPVQLFTPGGVFRPQDLTKRLYTHREFLGTGFWLADGEDLDDPAKLIARLAGQYRGVVR